MNEGNMCAICGGYTGTLLIRKLPALDRDGTPYPIAEPPPARFCPGHPEHIEGRQSGEISHHLTVAWVETPYHDAPIVALRPPQIGALPYALLYPQQALSLLAWLKQEEAKLEGLVKAHEEKMSSEGWEMT